MFVQFWVEGGQYVNFVRGFFSVILENENYYNLLVGQVILQIYCS